MIHWRFFVKSVLLDVRTWCCVCFQVVCGFTECSTSLSGAEVTTISCQTCVRENMEQILHLKEIVDESSKHFGTQGDLGRVSSIPWRAGCFGTNKRQASRVHSTHPGINMEHDEELRIDDFNGPRSLPGIQTWGLSWMKGYLRLFEDFWNKLAYMNRGFLVNRILFEVIKSLQCKWKALKL